MATTQIAKDQKLQHAMLCQSAKILAQMGHQERDPMLLEAARQADKRGRELLLQDMILEKLSQ